ncbi:MAG: hypothetical protein QOI20_729 [Acidimicrobiaceae bacterium]|nr:hypothetical protein [Acidimicrobiaceae bacterium]
MGRVRTIAIGVASALVLGLVPMANGAWAANASTPSAGATPSASAGAASPKHKPAAGAAVAHPLSAAPTQTAGRKLNERPPSQDSDSLAATTVEPPMTLTDADAADAHETPVKRGRFDPATSVELPDKATADSTTYKNADGSFTTEVSSAPVRFRGPDGAWRTIDTTLAAARGTNPNDDHLAPRATPVATRLATTAAARPLASIEVAPGHALAYAIRGAANVPATVVGARATYPDALPSTDVQVDTRPDGLKETLVLKSAAAPTEFTFPLTLTGLIPTVDQATGDVLFNDATGTTRARTPKATVEDAAYDPGPGMGATNRNSRYSIVATTQGPALKLTLDAAWIHDPARAFPIKVDPTTVSKTTESDDTYVQTNYSANNSTETELKAGTYDSGGHPAFTYLHFNTINSTYNNYYVTGAELDLYETHSWVCAPHSFSVYTVKASWSGSSMLSGPGAAYDATPVDTISTAKGDTCGGAGWDAMDVTDAVQAWTHGKANYGLTVRAGSNTDNYYWKNFASYTADPTNHTSAPKLKFTYTPYGALYAPGSAFTTPVTNNTDGVVPVKVTNWGTLTWPANSAYKLGYRVYDSAGAFVESGPRTPMPQDVSPREAITVNAKVGNLPPGSYKIIWDMVRDSVTWFSSEGVKMSTAQAFTVRNVAPKITATNAPSDKAAVTTTTPTFSVTGDDPDDYPGPVTYYFRVCTGMDAEAGTCFNSGWISASSWTLPANKLYWRTTYYWHVYIKDGSVQTDPTWVRSFTTVVPDANAASHFGDDPYGVSEGGVNPSIGNYVTSAFEAPVQSVGPQLGVQRTYNSGDAAGHAFGVGWSSLFDMRVDFAGANATVSYQDGRRQAFARNPDNTWAASPGYFATLTSSTSGATLSDKSSTTYTFDTTGALSSVTDPTARKVTLTPDGAGHTVFADVASGRSVTLTWTGAHITSATTPAVDGAGPRSWTYAYTGDRLDRACDPLDTPTDRHCTTYAYDAAGRLASVTRPKGNTTEQVHYDDVTGRVDWRQDGRNKRWTYAVTTQASPAQTTVTVTDPLLNAVSMTYDGSSRLILRKDELGNSRSFAYDVNGSVSRIADENGHAITLVNDGRGNVVKRTAYDGAPASYYDYYLGAANDLRNDRLVAYRDPRSSGPTDDRFKTSYTYTASGAPASTVTPPTAEFAQGTTESQSYTTGTEAAVGSTGTVPAGLLSTKTDALQRTTQFFYNAAGDPTRIIDRAGLQTDFAYDAMGRQVTATQFSNSYPGGLTTTSTYDALGRLETVTEPATTDAVTSTPHQRRTTYTYDANGNCTDVIVSDLRGNDPARRTHVDFDAADVAQGGTDAEGNTTSRRFDDAGRVVASIDGRGHVVGFGYTKRGELSSIVAQGFVDDPITPGPRRDVTLLQRTYDPAGRIDTEVDARGRTRKLAYYDDDRLKSVTLLGLRDPAGTTRDYVVESHDYDAAGNETTTRLGNTLRVVTSAYDAAGRLTGTTLDPTGLNRRVAYAHDANGNVLRQTVTDGTRTEEQRWTYDNEGRMLQSTVENGAVDLVTNRVRDQRGLVTSVTDPRGGTTTPPDPAYRTTMSYDPLGRLVRTDSPAVPNASGGTTAPVSFQGYDTFDDVVASKDANGNVTTVAFDRLGRPTVTTYPTYTPPGLAPITPTERRTYDANGNVVSMVDRRGQTTTFDYDNLNRPVRRTEPKANASAASGVTRFSYDDAGNTTSVVDQVGAVTESTYDDLNRLLSSTEVVRNGTATPSRFTTSYRYDDLGDVNRTTLPHGEVSYADYNAASERIQAQDGAGKIWRIGRDLAGRAASTTDPLNRVKRTTYDLAGRPTSVAEFGPTGTLLHTANTGYDLAGNVTSRTPSASGPGLTNSSTRTASYDALNRILSVTQPLANGSSATTAFAYDAVGNRVKTTDPLNQATTATFTPWNLPESVVEPATAAQPAAADRTFTDVYDAAGATVETRKPGGVSVTKTRDALGRVVKETGVGAPGLKSWTYDAVGRVTSISHPSGTQTFAYDDRGLLTGATGPAGAATLAYDEDGRLTSRTDAAGAATFTWDLRGLPATATDAVTGKTRTWTYTDAAEPRTETVGANGPVRTWTYTDRAQLASDVLAGPNGAATYRTDYTYDADGNVVTKAIGPVGTAGAGTSAYAYDLADRLVSWTPPGGAAVSYGYDAAGNRTSAAGVTSAYDERGRLLSDTAGNAYTYTPRGTLASRRSGTTTTALTADAFDRILNDGPSTYSYDALDRTALHNGTAMSYSGLDLEPVADGGVKVARDAQGDVLAQSGVTATATELLADGHADVTATFDPSTGSVSSATAYDPWGATTASSGSGTRGPLGMQSQWTDSATGSVHMQARWYSPARAQFSSRDEVTQDDWTVSGTNRYAYVSGNPLSGRDPSGHVGVIESQGAPAGMTAAQMEGGGGMGPPGSSNAIQALVDGIGALIGGALAWSGLSGGGKSSPQSAPATSHINFTSNSGVSMYWDPVSREFDWDTVGHGLGHYVYDWPSTDPRHGPPGGRPGGPRPPRPPKPKPLPPVVAPPVPDGGPGAFKVAKADLTNATTLVNEAPDRPTHIKTAKATDKGKCGAGGTVASCTSKTGSVPDGCSLLRTGDAADACEPATAAGAAGSGDGGRGRRTRTENCDASADRPSRKAEDQSIRRAARRTWQDVTGQEASASGLQVHHRIQIEWRDVYSGDINAIDNLAGLTPSDHAKVSSAWQQFKAGLCGRTPTEDELLAQRDQVDEMYGHLMQNLSDQ